MVPESSAPLRPAPLRQVGTVQTVGPDSIVVRLPDWPGHAPGQFAMLTLDPSGRSADPLLPRPMAVFRGDASGLEFRFHVVGRGTARLAELRPGDPLGVLGPLGRGFPSLDGSVLLVGGGTGIASLFEVAARGGPGVRLLLGARTRDALLGLECFQKLDVPLEITTEDGSLGFRGRVTDRLEPKPDDRVLACGPTPMMRAVQAIAERAGARCLVSLEANMACGVGICLGCAVPTRAGFRYVCTHGPVFEADALVWDDLP